MAAPTTSEVRAWAQDNGIKVAERGRLSADVVEAYRAAKKSGGSGPVKRPTAAPAGTRSEPAAASVTGGQDEIARLTQRVDELLARVSRLEQTAAAKPRRWARGSR